MLPSDDRPDRARRARWQHWLAAMAVQYLIACGVLVGFDGCAQYGFTQQPLTLLVTPLLSWVAGAVVWMSLLPAGLLALLPGTHTPLRWQAAGIIFSVALLLPMALAGVWVWLGRLARSSHWPRLRWLRWGVQFALLLVLNLQFVIGLCAAAGV
ncbi:MAG: hypothetical protein Q7T87_07020 [Polaromonas sp.]|nr:hypothetical protein [Polaromonas sp.]